MMFLSQSDCLSSRQSGSGGGDFVDRVVLVCLMMVCLRVCVCRWTAEALQKYMKSTRSEAPYLPCNIQYIANNNALECKEDVSPHVEGTDRHSK